MFCSGFRLDGSAAEAMRSGAAAEAAGELFDAMSSCPVPIVAMIDGPAHGGGCELALRCDLRIASTQATFGVPSGRLGLAYTPSSLSFMVSRLGPSAVTWLMLSGQHISAATALHWGFVHQVVEPDAVEEAAATLVENLAHSAPLVIAYLRGTIAAAGQQQELPPAVHALKERVLASGDYTEALSAIDDRRAPVFRGS
jgi:enoyl-CoA hydratase/carnithine racemase